MASVDGTWVVHIRFVRGEATHSMQIEQEGDQVHGRYRSQYGEREVRGRVEGSEVFLRVPMHYQAVGTTYGFHGVIEGDVLRGAVDLGEYWRGEWEAVRPT